MKQRPVGRATEHSPIRSPPRALSSPAVTVSGALAAFLVSFVVLGVAGMLWRQRLDSDLLRSQQLGRLADEVGWSFTTDDVFDYGAMPFALFDWRDGGRASNVLVGAASDGQPVCTFDYRAPARGNDGPVRFTCVITDVGGAWPRLVVQPRDRADRWPSLDVALLDQIDPVEAHDDFRVWSHDEFFARTFLDSPLGDWLADEWPTVQFETSGDLLLVWFTQQSPRRIHEALGAVDALRSRIPGEVWAHYPADRPGTSG
jgi:hypothetical protein